MSSVTSRISVVFTLLICLYGCLPMDAGRRMNLEGGILLSPNTAASVRVAIGHDHDQLLEFLSGKKPKYFEPIRDFAISPDGQFNANFGWMSGGFLTPFGIITGSGPRPHFSLQFSDNPDLAYIVDPESKNDLYTVLNVRDFTRVALSTVKWKLTDLSWKKIDHGWHVSLLIVPQQI